MNNLNDRFRDAVELLYKKNQYLAAEVTRLGFPTLTGNCKTAQVIWDKNKKRINFEFNKKFADGLTDEEFAFVISHEAVHIINSHIFTLLENINKFKTKSNPELMSFMKKFAIASDCIVNDSLTNLYGFEKLLNPPMDPNTGMPEIDPKTGKPKIKGLYGKEIVGFDCHDYDVMTVISMLKDQQGNNGKDGDKKKGQKQKGQGSGQGSGEPGDELGDGDVSDMSADDVLDDHGWDSFFDQNGNLNKDFVEQMADFYEKHDGDPALSSEEQDQLDKMEKKLAAQGGLQAGSSSGRSKVNIAKDPNKMKWDKMLVNIVETKKIEDKWNKIPRKLSGFYPDLILPKTEDKEMYEIVVAIDISGSIDFEMLKLFLNLVRNAPKNLKITAFTFNTQAEEFDIKSDTVNAGGGTSFACIENYILKTYKKYPKAVVIMTDGHGDQVSPKYPERWIWLLYGSYTNSYCRAMKHYELKSFM